MSQNEETPVHFKGKDAVGHVAEAQAEGLISAAEVHGTEVPGHISAAADAARETAIVLLLLWCILISLHSPQILPILLIFSIGWSLWKLCRGAWLGWSRLERLHRVLAQERWEIEHHRQQERAELTELYTAKGLQGKLLEDVMDVLMADDNRLLQIMVEEELGLKLESHEHPLKQGLGAFLGSIAAALICLGAIQLFPFLGIVIAALTVLGVSGAILAQHSQNRMIPAIVWNIGIGALVFGIVYFLLQYMTFLRTTP